MKRAPRHRRARWLREIGESKIDMGLIAPMSQDALDASLYMAVLEDNHALVRGMKGSGANPDMEADGKLGEPTGTLLHFAVRHASLKTVLALLHLGANPFLIDSEGHTPREAALERIAGGHIRDVLAQWEKKKSTPDTGVREEEGVLDFLGRAAS